VLARAIVLSEMCKFVSELGKNLKRHCNENTRANRVWILQLLREGEVEQTLVRIGICFPEQ